MILLLLYLFIYTLYSISEIVNNTIDRNQLLKFRKFKDDVSKWMDEIKDPEIYRDVLHFYIINLSMDGIDKIISEERKVEELREIFINKYSEYIPSLKSEIRNSKIDSIL